MTAIVNWRDKGKMKIKEKRKIERGELRNIIHKRNSDAEKFGSNIRK